MLLKYKTQMLQMIANLTTVIKLLDLRYRKNIYIKQKNEERGVEYAYSCSFDQWNSTLRCANSICKSSLTCHLSLRHLRVLFYNENKLFVGRPHWYSWGNSRVLRQS